MPILPDLINEDMTFKLDATEVMMFTSDDEKFDYKMSFRDEPRYGSGWFKHGNMFEKCDNYLHGNVVDVDGQPYFTFADFGKMPFGVSYYVNKAIYPQQSVLFQWRKSRVGPQMQTCRMNGSFKRVLFNSIWIDWKPEYDEWCDFFGDDFFRSEVDRCRYLADPETINSMFEGKS